MAFRKRGKKGLHWILKPLMQKEQPFLYSVHSIQLYNVGNYFRQTASLESLCSVIYVCLSIIHTKRIIDEKASFCFSTSLIFPVPNFELY